MRLVSASEAMKNTHSPAAWGMQFHSPVWALTMSPMPKDPACTTTPSTEMPMKTS